MNETDIKKEKEAGTKNKTANATKQVQKEVQKKVASLNLEEVFLSKPIMLA
jgi:hypothetical protein